MARDVHAVRVVAVTVGHDAERECPRMALHGQDGSVTTFFKHAPDEGWEMESLVDAEGWKVDVKGTKVDDDELLELMSSLMNTFGEPIDANMN